MSAVWTFVHLISYEASCKTIHPFLFQRKCFLLLDFYTQFQLAPYCVCMIYESVCVQVKLPFNSTSAT